MNTILKLSTPSKWLIRYLAERYPLGVASHTALPCNDYKKQPGMIHMRGLVRRGWAVEPANGIFYATESGLQAAQILIAHDDTTYP